MGSKPSKEINHLERMAQERALEGEITLVSVFKGITCRVDCAVKWCFAGSL